MFAWLVVAILAVTDHLGLAAMMAFFLILMERT